MKKVNIYYSTFELIKGDITKQDTQAIVNAANNRLIPGGGVDGAIHRAAGPKLFEECKKLGGCKTGEAKLTKGYNLNSKYVIQTVGPRYSGSKQDKEKLRLCYINCLKIAKKNNIGSVSFPAISTGVYGYPVRESAKIALSAVIDFIKNDSSIHLIRFILFDSNVYDIYENELESILQK